MEKSYSSQADESVVSIRTPLEAVRTRHGDGRIDHARLKALHDEDLDQFHRFQEELLQSWEKQAAEEDRWQQRFETSPSCGDRAADKVAIFGGSWKFIIAVSVYIVVWALLNAAVLGEKSRWDPYPFYLLNVTLSLFAALQAPIILMSQNRQSDVDRRMNDYTSRETLRLELSAVYMNSKLDWLLGDRWRRLWHMQNAQISLLEGALAAAEAKVIPHTRGTKGNRNVSVWSCELRPDQHFNYLMRAHRGDPLEQLVFERHRGQGDNFMGTVERVDIVWAKSKTHHGVASFPWTVSYDLVFNERASLDSILSGEGYVHLRNAFGLPCMDMGGKLRSLDIHFRGLLQPVPFVNGRLPTRYQESFDFSAEAHITDFWKQEVTKLSLVYRPAHAFVLLELAQGATLRSLVAAFAPQQSSSQVSRVVLFCEPTEEDLIGATAGAAEVLATWTEVARRRPPADEDIEDEPPVALKLPAKCCRSEAANNLEDPGLYAMLCIDGAVCLRGVLDTPSHRQVLAPATLQLDVAPPVVTSGRARTFANPAWPNGVASTPVSPIDEALLQDSVPGLPGGPVPVLDGGEHSTVWQDEQAAVQEATLSVLSSSYRPSKRPATIGPRQSLLPATTAAEHQSEEASTGPDSSSSSSSSSSTSHFAHRVPLEEMGHQRMRAPAPEFDFPQERSHLRSMWEQDVAHFNRLQETALTRWEQHYAGEAMWREKFDTKKTCGEAIADKVAAVGGSWKFIIVFSGGIVLWCLLNSADWAWDPYPFSLMNICFSMIAAFQAPIIMMSQNRRALTDRMKYDYTTRSNLRAELAARHTNAKLDLLLGDRWKRLWLLQDFQVTLARRIRAVLTPGGLATRHRRVRKAAWVCELRPDPHLTFLLRTARGEVHQQLLFVHQHRKGDNFTGEIARVRLVRPALHTKAVASAAVLVKYDIVFQGKAALDSILAGEGTVSLANCEQLPQLMMFGRIQGLEIFVAGRSAPHVFRNGELPSRYQATIDWSIEARIADFWKLPVTRIVITYRPAPSLVSVVLARGAVLGSLTATFHDGPAGADANLWLASDPTDEVLHTFAAKGPEPGAEEWTVVARGARCVGEPQPMELPPRDSIDTDAPSPATTFVLAGPGVYAFYCGDSSVTLRGVLETGIAVEDGASHVNMGVSAPSCTPFGSVVLEDEPPSRDVLGKAGPRDAHLPPISENHVLFDTPEGIDPAHANGYAAHINGYGAPHMNGFASELPIGPPDLVELDEITMDPTGFVEMPPGVLVEEVDLRDAPPAQQPLRAGLGPAPVTLADWLDEDSPEDGDAALEMAPRERSGSSSSRSGSAT